MVVGKNQLDNHAEGVTVELSNGINQLVEWELLTWSGKMNDGGRIGAFVNETLMKMNEPFLTEVNRPIG